MFFFFKCFFFQFFFFQFFSNSFFRIFFFYLFVLGTFDTKFLMRIDNLYLAGKMFKNICLDSVWSGRTCLANLDVRSCPVRKLIYLVRLSPNFEISNSKFKLLLLCMVRQLVTKTSAQAGMKIISYAITLLSKFILFVEFPYYSKVRLNNNNKPTSA